MHPWPAESTNRSRLGQRGFPGLWRRCRVQRIYAAGAIPIGIPGCPDFAFWTASIDRQRIVFMQSSSRALRLGWRGSSSSEAGTGGVSVMKSESSYDLVEKGTKKIPIFNRARCDGTQPDRRSFCSPQPMIVLNEPICGGVMRLNRAIRFQFRDNGPGMLFAQLHSPLVK